MVSPTPCCISPPVRGLFWALWKNLVWLFFRLCASELFLPVRLYQAFFTPGDPHHSIADEDSPVGHVRAFRQAALRFRSSLQRIGNGSQRRLDQV